MLLVIGGIFTGMKGGANSNIMVLLFGKMSLNLGHIPATQEGLVAVQATPGFLEAIRNSRLVLEDVGVLPNTVK